MYLFYIPFPLHFNIETAHGDVWWNIIMGILLARHMCAMKWCLLGKVKVLPIPVIRIYISRHCTKQFVAVWP